MPKPKAGKPGKKPPEKPVRPTNIPVGWGSLGDDFGMYL